LHEHAPYYAGHPVVKSQHENGAFTWLKIAFAMCLSDTAMSVFENMIIQQQLLKKQMHNAHNYELFPLATIIGLQVNHTIQPKLLMFNITTTKTPKANATPSI
jgi:hypothetical protein